METKKKWKVDITLFPQAIWEIRAFCLEELNKRCSKKSSRFSAGSASEVMLFRALFLGSYSYSRDIASEGKPEPKTGQDGWAALSGWYALLNCFGSLAIAATVCVTGPTLVQLLCDCSVAIKPVYVRSRLSAKLRASARSHVSGVLPSTVCLSVLFLFCLFFFCVFVYFISFFIFDINRLQKPVWETAISTD